jgi:hypothetical protein
VEDKPANNWFHFPLEAVGILFCVYFYFHLPGSGKALLVLGAMAAIMMLMDMRLIHKGMYVLIILSLVLIENRALDKERADSAIEQSRTRKEENEKFQSIADGIQTAISNSDQEFEATMGRANQVLLNVTGGDSFGFIVPQSFGEQVPLLVWNHGDQPLIGVTIAIARTQEPAWGNAFYKPIFIGTIGPHDHAPVPGFLSLKPEEKSGQDHYWIMIAAQNGTVSQSLYFRKNHKGLVPWAYSYSVDKFIFTKRRLNSVLTNVTTTKNLLRRRWSDEVDEPH